MILMIPVVLLFLVLLATFITILVRSSGRASGDDRSLPVRFRESFLNVVPKPARTAASAMVLCAGLIGLVVGCVEARVGTPHGGAGDHFTALWPILGCVMGLFIGSLFAIWTIGLGYVWADSRRRNMPHIPWTLVAAIVPNLLGFLLYFVLRKPIAFPCPQCGQPKTPDQLFCPWCGYRALTQPPAAIAQQTI